MKTVDAIRKESIDWHVAATPLAGQTVSGDLHLVQSFPGGVLLAVVDGLGHGDLATAAARMAVDILQRHAAEPVISLVRRCHSALAGTRGVVMTLASLSTAEKTTTWLGIGNVEAVLFRKEAGGNCVSKSILLRSGLVGSQLPELHTSSIAVLPGDLLILATDGLQPGFEAVVTLSETVQQNAERILRLHARGTDDALVLVARYTGNPADPNPGNVQSTFSRKSTSTPKLKAYGTDSHLAG